MLARWHFPVAGLLDSDSGTVSRPWACNPEPVSACVECYGEHEAGKSRKKTQGDEDNLNALRFISSRQCLHGLGNCKSAFSFLSGNQDDIDVGTSGHSDCMRAVQRSPCRRAATYAKGGPELETTFAKQ